jgi:hypothetical protein
MVWRFSKGTPNFSKASSKFIFIDLACPTCKYPLGSGGNRVRIFPLFVARCSANSSGVLTADGSSLAARASWDASSDMVIAFSAFGGA